MTGHDRAPAPGPVRDLPAQTLLVALVAFGLVVAATPLARWPLLVLDGLLVCGALALARVPPRWVLPRLVVELPVVVFCAVLPFVAAGPRTRVAGLMLSIDGIAGAAGLLARATLGVLAALVLVGSHRPHEIVDGLERLRLPRTLVQILTSMVRSVDLVVDDQRRMAVARAARAGGSPGLAATAASAGQLFVRSHERAERIQRSMLARGYAGRLPGAGSPATPAQWAAVLVLLAVALLALLAGAGA